MCKSDIIKQIREDALQNFNSETKSEGIQYVYEIIRNVDEAYNILSYRAIVDFKLRPIDKWFSIYWSPKHPTYVVCTKNDDDTLDLVSIATGSEELREYIRNIMNLSGKIIASANQQLNVGEVCEAMQYLVEVLKEEGISDVHASANVLVCHSDIFFCWSEEYPTHFAMWYGGKQWSLAISFATGSDELRKAIRERIVRRYSQLI